MPNVIVTSHQAFLTEEALGNIAEATVDNLQRFFAGTGDAANEVCYRCGQEEHCKKARQEKCF
jgi:D-lactate dehydrogenase